MNSQGRKPTSADLRDIAWRIAGVAHFIKHTESDAVPDKFEIYGIGQVLSLLADDLAVVADEIEGVRDE